MQKFLEFFYHLRWWSQQYLGKISNLTKYPLDVEHSSWKMVIGRLLSYWEGHFLGAIP